MKSLQEKKTCMMIFEFNLNDNISYQYRGINKILKKDNLNDILNLLANKILRNGVDQNGYTLIYSYEIKVVNWEYKAYLSYLLSVGFIERDYYLNTEDNKKPYGYRFTEKMKEIIELSGIIYRPNQNESKKKIQKHDKNVSISSDVFDRLKKDFLGAEIIYNLKNGQIEKTKDEWGNFYDIEKWLHNNVELNKWRKGYISFIWSSERLYTNFVRLSSNIRANNIQLNGEKIVEFDVKSSFPLMLALYCLNVNPKIFNDPDFESYCNSLINGTFYDDLKQGLNSFRNSTKGDKESDYGTRQLSKNEAKILFQMYLNGNENKVHYLNGVSCDINIHMEYKYQSIHQILVQLKDEGKKPYDELVRIETKLIFEIVAELYDNLSDIKILTCHDAIYVPESYETKTRIIWDKHMNNIKSTLPVEPEIELDISKLESLEIYCDDDDWD